MASRSNHLQFEYHFYFSDLQEDLAAIQNNPSRSIYCSQRLLCRTLAGNNVYILTVTSPGTTVSNHVKYI